MTGVRPTALAYVSGPEAALSQQRAAVARYAETEGFALERFVADRGDTLTISQLVTDARACGARVVLIAADAHMATAHARVLRDLEPHGATCVVVGSRPPSTHERAGHLTTHPLRRRQEGAAASTPHLLDVT